MFLNVPLYLYAGGRDNLMKLRGIRVTPSGRTGDDAKPYQEPEGRRAIEEVQS